MTTNTIGLEAVDVAIVGAGAAGLAVAAFLGRRAPRLRVVLFEGARKPGAKILVSGGSRCNVTNATVTDRDFWGGSRASIRQVLRAFSVADTRQWFGRLGVTLHEEPLGKLFPDSNKSRDVLDALLREVTGVGAVLFVDHRVTALTRAEDGFVLETTHGPCKARRVVLATGGRALPKSGSDGGGYVLAHRLGHTIVDTTPALAPLLLDEADAAHATLSGVAHPAEITVWVDGRVSERLSGALLWAHFGISGPVALDASRVWARARIERKDTSATMNVMAGAAFDTVDAHLVTLAQERPRAGIGTLLTTLLPGAVCDVVLASSGVERETPACRLDRDARRRLVRALTEWPLAVTDTRGYTYAEATAGGVVLSEINPRTMESRVCPGLSLVGEVLDADGRLGGFNFQWAWSSAWVAARGIAGGASGM